MANIACLVGLAGLLGLPPTAWFGAQVRCVNLSADKYVSAASLEIPGRYLKAKLVRVDPKSRLLTARLKWKGVKTFEVAEDARITRNGNAVKLRRLRPRDQLRMRARRGPNGRMLIIIHAWMPLHQAMQDSGGSSNDDL